MMCGPPVNNKKDKISASFLAIETKHLVMIIFFIFYKVVAMATMYHVRY